MKSKNVFKSFKSTAAFCSLFIAIFSACNSEPKLVEELEVYEETITYKLDSSDVSFIVLGTVQDAGSPHMACKKDCCRELFAQQDYTRKVVSLGLIDRIQKKKWLFEASPNIASQMKFLKEAFRTENELPDGIFITHAHIGHYTGLMYLGKEASDASNIPVYAMPRMHDFLKSNGPWSQLVSQNNIQLNKLNNNEAIALNDKIRVVPIQVPHRDEYSETVGYSIQGPKKKVLFIPDIDKWATWEKDIIQMVKEHDYAFIDGTFYSGDELKQRDLTKIPHPFVIETMELFSNQDAGFKNKVWFIHFNHTNPMLNKYTDIYKNVITKGFHIAEFGMSFGL